VRGCEWVHDCQVGVGAVCSRVCLCGVRQLLRTTHWPGVVNPPSDWGVDQAQPRCGGSSVRKAQSVLRAHVKAWTALCTDFSSQSASTVSDERWASHATRAAPFTTWCPHAFLPLIDS
jgi:hypothetical protein